MSGQCGTSSLDSKTKLSSQNNLGDAQVGLIGLNLEPAISGSQKSKKENAMNGVAEVGKSTFQSEVLQSDVPVVVDFYATWCGPCRRLSPLLKELSEDFQGRIKFVKIDSDQEPELSSEYSITALPTLLFFDGGKLAGQFAGLPDKASLKAELENWIDQ